ncbi:helix-turn-helix domain-containing protein [Arthrobacter sp. STN4]|uniref:helix-turn-helix domain-containing protein n=1 Tax=Arthrobacter sp. STN4 TaxID=2923276 RepID=UPI002119CA08|nr:helix-turn-helix transcriptional regulator [Arthrobacter sp. STN4]MCQ9162778.1 helix-turn-helix domain-containing protein [Arthrobacter sp. STN4]
MGIFDSDDPEFALAYAEEAAMIDASELIAEALEKSGMARVELARALDVSKSEVTARLAGERNITVRNLAKTLHMLGARLELNMVNENARAAKQVNRVVRMEDFRAFKRRKATSLEERSRRMTDAELRRAIRAAQ